MMANSKKRILVIDNDEAVCRMVETILTDQDYAVSAYTRSLDAMAGFAPGKYDLVITDIKMPIMNGIHATKAIKEKHPQIKVLVLTTYDADAWLFDEIWLRG